jgi:hypothetical protein
MKALLLKKWGTNYAGQVLTNVEKGSIPSGYASYYEDNEPSPMDVVKDESAGGDPLAVINDAIDPEQEKVVAKRNKALIEAAKKPSASSQAEVVAAAEDEATQRRAKEADDFAAKQLKAAGKDGGLSDEQLEGLEAGKGHGPKVTGKK